MSSSSAAGLTAIASALPALSIVIVGLRFCARRQQNVGIKLDDAATIPALLFVIGLGALAIYSVKEKGYGTSKVASGTTASGVGPTLYIFQLLQVPALGFIKIAALLFFRRIFCPSPKQTFLGASMLVMLVIVGLWMIAFEITFGANCGDHVWAQWSGIDNYFKYCTIAYPNAFGFAISDFILDVIIISLPIIGTWSLQMSIQRKLGVTLIFLTALVGLAAAIARLVYITYVEKHGTAESTDTRLEDTELFFWGILEAGLSFIAINLPTIWSLLSKSTPERIIRSVRSLVSLQSRHSRSPSATHKPSDNSLSTHNDAPAIPEIPANAATGSYAMDRIEV